MRLAEQISPDEVIDYYWSLHRLHSHYAIIREQLALKSQDVSQRKMHGDAKERHHKKSLEHKKSAIDFEKKVYPGLFRMIRDN